MIAKGIPENQVAFIHEADTETQKKALNVFYRHPKQIEQMKIKAMEKDFSWDVEGGSLYKYYNLLSLGHL